MRYIQGSNTIERSGYLLISAAMFLPAMAQTTPTPLGQTSGSPAAGSAVYFETQAKAYQAVDRITTAIAADICSDATLKNGTFVLFDSVSFQAVQQYRSFANGLAVLTSVLQSYSPPASNGADSTLDHLKQIQEKLKAATSGTSGAPSLLVAEGIFSTFSAAIAASTTDKASSFPISDVAIAMSLSSKFAPAAPKAPPQKTNPSTAMGCGTVIYPRVSLAQPITVAGTVSDNMTAALAELFAAQRAAAKVAQTQEGGPPSPLPAGTQTAASNPPVNPMSSFVQPHSVTGADYLALTGASGLIDNFLTQYLQPAASTGVAPISGVLSGALLLNSLAQPNTYILFWEGSASGGTQRDIKNLLTNLITGDWIRYSGGAVISFGMIDAQSGKLWKPSVHYETIK